MCALVLYLVLTNIEEVRKILTVVFFPPLITFLFEVIVLQGVDFLRQTELCGHTHTQSEHTEQGQEVFRKMVKMLTLYFIRRIWIVCIECDFGISISSVIRKHSRWLLLGGKQVRGVSHFLITHTLACCVHSRQPVRPAEQTSGLYL